MLYTAILALTFAALANSSNAVDASSDWSPVHTRSEHVPFAPEFLIQPSHQSRSKTLQQIEAIGALHARSHAKQAHSEQSIFSTAPKILNVAHDDHQ
jgi:hypothetical protein